MQKKDQDTGLMRLARFGLMLLAVCCLNIGICVADQTRFHTDGAGVAAGGYDPVSYFTQGEPIRGDESITYVYMGATFRFASESSRVAFIADPERYVPQYGGHCAWAVANGYTARGSPRHWKIVDGKLYLNYNAGVRRRWLEDAAGLIVRGDANWPAVLE